MKSVSVLVEDALYARLQLEADKMGWPSISSYLLNKAGEGEDVVMLCTNAFHRVLLSDRIRCGEDFTLESLFAYAEWNAIPKPLRLKLGAMFAKRVKFNPDFKIVRVNADGIIPTKYKKL